MKRLLLSGLTLSVLALVVVGATGAFFNDTESSEGNVFTAGSVDLKVDHYFQNYNGNDCEEFCEPTGSDLVTNGNFTNPDIDNGTWDIVSSDDVPGWTVEWESTEDTYEGEDRPEPALAEYQDGVNGWNAYDGQWVELDSDWDGPSGSLSGEPASTRITQEIDTTPGTKYRISFAFSPRPGANNTQNQLEVVWNGAVVDTLSENGGGNTNWQVYTYDVMASGEDTLLEFADVGTPDSAGTFLDAISVIELDCDYTLPGASQCQLWEETDLNSERFFDFTDIKPGDTGRNGISLHVYDNPAYACLIAHDGEDDENTVFETEGDDDDTAGELQDYITVFTWVDEDQDGLYDPSDEDALDTTTLGDLGSIAALDSNNGEFLSATTTEYIGLAWCAGTIDVDDTTGEISCDGSTMLDDAQSDIFTASLTAFAEQTRHNDNFSCANVVLDEDDGGDEGPEVVFENGFETDLEFWFAYPGPLDRVPSGTNGVDSVEGSNHAEVTGGAFTRWGGYSTTFPTDGYTTEVKVYLDMAEADGSDKRFDFSTAISTPADDHRRDFIFHLGTNPGTPGQWAASVSNNAPGWPLNPGRSPVDITTSGWYTLQAYFHENGLGELVVTMNVLDDSDSIVGTWDLTDASDVIGSTVGGNRYGWFLNIDTDLAPLAFDDSVLYLGAPN